MEHVALNPIVKPEVKKALADLKRKEYGPILLDNVTPEAVQEYLDSHESNKPLPERIQHFLRKRALAMVISNKGQNRRLENLLFSCIPSDSEGGHGLSLCNEADRILSRDMKHFRYAGLDGGGVIADAYFKLSQKNTDDIDDAVAYYFTTMGRLCSDAKRSMGLVSNKKKGKDVTSGDAEAVTSVPLTAEDLVKLRPGDGILYNGKQKGHFRGVVTMNGQERVKVELAKETDTLDGPSMVFVPVYSIGRLSRPTTPGPAVDQQEETGKTSEENSHRSRIPVELTDTHLKDDVSYGTDDYEIERMEKAAEEDPLLFYETLINAFPPSDKNKKKYLLEMAQLMSSGEERPKMLEAARIVASQSDCDYTHSALYFSFYRMVETVKGLKGTLKADQLAARLLDKYAAVETDSK